MERFAIRDGMARYLGIDPTEELPALAWPGGYPIYYYDEEGNMLCPDCAEKYRHQIRSADVYWEGPDMQCDECSKSLESAYGDPDVDDEDDEELPPAEVEHRASMAAWYEGVAAAMHEEAQQQ